MITVQANEFPVQNDNIHKVLYSRELIRALARQIVAGQVEGHLEMISDCSSDYSSFKEVESCIQGAKETVIDYAEDLLTDFRDTLYAEIAKVDIRVDSVVFKKDGEIDADVFVSCPQA